MRIFTLYTPRFLEWALAISEELNKRDPNISLMGIVAGSRNVFDRIKGMDAFDIKPLYYLDDLEHKWLSSSDEGGRAEKYERKLGPGILRRIITADRQLGVGLISGACVAPTGLMARTRMHEMIRRYVLGLLAFLFETIEQHRPDLVFWPGVADALGFALGQVSAVFNIPFMRLSHTRIGRRYILDDSPEGLLVPVKRTFQKALDDPSFLGHLVPSAREYLERFRSHTVQPSYAVYHRTNFEKNVSLKSLIRQTIKDMGRVAYNTLRRPEIPLRSASAWPRFKHNFQVSVKARQLIRNGPFRNLGDFPTDPFAYFPLHYEPEASTMVAAPMHTNQFAIVEALAKSLPLSMNLVVKEHITMLGSRPKGFYEQFTRIPCVVMASPFEDSISLIRNSSLTCVITGTAGWEAILLRRPALIIGEPPFLTIGGGFVHCPDLSNFSEVISRGLNVAPVDDDRLSLYVAAILEQSFEFPTELRWGTVTGETVRQRSDILNNICERLLASI